MSDGERGGDEGPRSDRRAGREPGARAGDDRLREQVTELAETLTELEAELGGGSRRPQLRDLVRFTREVTIPAVILVLRTNIQALKLLQRALAFGDRNSGDEGRLRQRAEEAGRSALTELDGALEDLGDALSGTQDSRARDLLGQAQDLQAEVETELSRESGADPDTGVGVDDSEGVEIDVDAELRSIKDELDEGNGAGDGRDEDAG